MLIESLNRSFFEENAGLNSVVIILADFVIVKNPVIYDYLAAI